MMELNNRNGSYEDVIFSRNGGSTSEGVSILNSSQRSGFGAGFREFKSYNCWYKCWAWAKDGFTIISTCFVILTIAITIAMAFQLQFGRPQVAPQGAVASDAAECSSDAGLLMLKERGSAVDAVIAALLCVSVSHPHLAGVGGGGVMLIHDHLQMTTSVIDFLPDIPKKYDPSERSDINGGATVGVPGFLQGLKHAHEKYGKLTWEELFTPAIKRARDGFEVPASLEGALAKVRFTDIPSPVSSFQSTVVANSFSEVFMPNGVKLSQKQKIKRESYAQLLEKVSLYGPKAVFDTDFAVEVVKLLRESGSRITVNELQKYKVQEYSAISAHYRNRTVFTVPEPFGGPQLLSALNLMDHTGVNSTTNLPVMYKHIVGAINATAPAFYTMATDPNDREEITEDLFSTTSHLSLHSLYPDFDEEFPIVDQVRYSAKASHLMDINAKLQPGYIENLSSHQLATQVSAIDTFDLYVAAVTGLGSPFGSLLMTSHGVLFNNMLSDTPVNPNTERSEPEEGGASEDNSAPLHNDTLLLEGLGAPREGRVRPLVQYAPFIVVEKNYVCGWRVVCSSSSVSDSVHVLSQHLFGEQPINFAVTQPRVAVDFSRKNLLRVHDLADSPRLPGEVRNYLKSRGFELRMLDQPYASVNSVAKFKDALTSHSDTRGGGVAARIGDLWEDEEGNHTTTAEFNAWAGSATKSGSQDEIGRSVTGSGLKTGLDAVAKSITNSSVSENKKSIEKAPDVDIPATASEGNSKFIGDATREEAYTELEASGPDGTGKVVKGDLRGGVNSSPPRQFVNGGRGGEANVNLSTVSDNRARLIHPSQVRQDDYDQNAADFNEYPVNVWNDPHRIVGSQLPNINQQQQYHLQPHPLAINPFTFNPQLNDNSPKDPRVAYSQPQDPRIPYSQPQDPRITYSQPQDQRVLYSQANQPIPGLQVVPKSGIRFRNGNPVLGNPTGDGYFDVSNQ